MASHNTWPHFEPLEFAQDKLREKPASERNQTIAYSRFLAEPVLSVNEGLRNEAQKWVSSTNLNSLLGPLLQVTVRPAVPRDENIFVRAQVEGWQHAYKDLLPASYLLGSLFAERRDFWRDEFNANRPHQLLAVAELQGEVVGVTSAFSAIPITNGECCIDQLYVLPPHKRKGVGKQLIAAAAAWCEKRGSRRVVLSVIEASTDAVKFYAALGGSARVAGPWLPPCGGTLPVLEFVWPDIRVLSRCA